MLCSFGALKAAPFSEQTELSAVLVTEYYAVIDSIYDLGVPEGPFLRAAPFLERDLLSANFIAAKVLSAASLEEIEALSTRLGGPYILQAEPLLDGESLSATIVGVPVSLAAAPFFESESLFSSVQPSVFTESSVGLLNSIETGQCFLMPCGAEAVKLISAINTIGGQAVTSWGLLNTLSGPPVNVSFGLLNELTERETASASWGVLATIGDYASPDGPGSFWGQGPVVHKAGSRGGYA